MRDINIPPTVTLGHITCLRCGLDKDVSQFAPTKSPFFKGGRVSLCNKCITEYLNSKDFSWAAIDDVCRWANVPFIAREWDRLLKTVPKENMWNVYSNIFAADCYQDLGWADYYRQYIKLKEAGLIEEELPLIREERYKKLREKWGGNYSDGDLNYLEELYKGLMATQNVSGALQIDQAQKICKLSLEIDSRIRAGDKDVDKFLSSYDKLVKTAEFTPKNTKNSMDFDSFAEVGKWLEKKGKVNKFYDNVTRDVIDETLKNIENYNQRLYINEGGIGEAITERINALNATNDAEKGFYNLEVNGDLTNYDNDGYDLSFEDNDFNPNGGD